MRPKPHLVSRLLRFGKPVACDGVNLLTRDMLSHDSDEALRQRTRDLAAIDDYRGCQIFKPDTTWKWNPRVMILPPAVSFVLLDSARAAMPL